MLRAHTPAAFAILFLIVGCDDTSKDEEIARLKAQLAENQGKAAPVVATVAAAQPSAPAPAPEPAITAQQVCEHLAVLAKPANKQVDVAKCAKDGAPHEAQPKFQEQARCTLGAQTWAEQRLRCQGQEAVLQTFKGKGQHTVRPFKVADKWEIKWDAKGDIFQVMLYAADGEMLDIVANQQGSGTGSAFRPKGGEYYLTMNAMGSWTVEIVQLP